jgi:hypothetical protein
MNGILNVIYTSVWDEGFEVVTSAKYDTQTKAVFDIEKVPGVNLEGKAVVFLNEVYITLPGGEKLSVEFDGKEYKVID